MSKKTISIFTTIQGHSSIATAINQSLKPRYSTHTNLHHSLEFKLYTTLYKYAPKAFIIPYALGYLSPIKYLTNLYLKHTYQQKITNQLQSQKPDLVISTWFMLNSILETTCTKLNIPFINVIANPRSIHPLEVTYNSPNLVFDQQAANRLKKLQVPNKHIIQTGWFVRSQFTPPANTSNLRQTLDLKPNLPTLLLMGGSEGSQKMIDILHRIHLLDSPTQIIVICGKSIKFFTQAQTISQRVITKNPQLSILVKGFTKNIHHYIQASDLVIGKAGPNLIFESATCHTPFFATNHIYGQENGNLELIKDLQIGVVEENINHIIPKLNHLSKNPNSLRQFSTHCRHFSVSNHQHNLALPKKISALLDH